MVPKHILLLLSIAFLAPRLFMPSMLSLYLPIPKEQGQVLPPSNKAFIKYVIPSTTMIPVDSFP